MFPEIINMEKDWNNMLAENTECVNSDQNATGHTVGNINNRWDSSDADDWDLTKTNGHKSNVCTNYTDWDPINNNGYTDDDKLADNCCYDQNNESFNDTGCADSNQTKSEVDYQTDTTDLESGEPQSLNDSWGNPISSEQVTNSTDTGNYSEFNGYTEQNSYNSHNYQKYESNGYHNSGRGYQQGTRFAKNSNKNGNYDKSNGKFEKPVIQKSTYIPPDFEENDDLTMEAGLNFDKYDKIEVTVSGMEVPKHITSFHESGLREILLCNLAKLHYTVPTPIQKYAIPIIMNGKDMIASAQTGSGKTVS